VTAAESVPIAGSRVGRYVIIREVAQGPLGPLYIAEREVGDGVSHGLARVVVLPPGLPAKDEQALADAIWDSTNLTHGLVLRVADVVTGKGWFTLIHEHSEGSLIEFLQRCAEERKTAFPAKVAARIALDVIEGLEQSRDHCAGASTAWRPGSVAPGSLLIGPDGRIRALDGQITSAALRVPALRTQSGSMAFAAPEMLDDSREPSERSDVFSIGVLLWELLTGKTLFGEKVNALDLGYAFKIPKVVQAVPDGFSVPQGLVHAVHTALEAEPLKRQASLRELAVAIVMGVEEVATYDQVINFTHAILEPVHAAQPEVSLPEEPLRQHTPPTPDAVLDMPATAQPAPSEVAPAQPEFAVVVPLLQRSPASEPLPAAQPAPEESAVTQAADGVPTHATAQNPPEQVPEASVPPPRDKLDTLPGQGSETLVGGVATRSNPAPARDSFAPAASVQPPPVQPFRLVSDEPFIPLAAQPVQAVGEVPSSKRPGEAAQAAPSIASVPAPAQSLEETRDLLQGSPKKRTLQLNVSTLILGFLTTVLAVIVIMLVMMRSQATTSREAQPPPRTSVPGSATPGAGQPVEAPPAANAATSNAREADSATMSPLAAKPDQRKRLGKDQSKSSGKSGASEGEPSDSKGGQPPSTHYVPNEL
jgi:serine/threonine protein kinase